MYGTDLRHVSDRPLSVAQECLRSRLVYATQERRSFSALYEFYSTVQDMWNPLEYYDGLEDAVQEASFGARAEASSSSSSKGGGATSTATVDQGSFEEFRRVREEAAYYLSTEGKAPVWVSEFGTGEGSTSTWWNYTLRSLAQSDLSWFYSPLGEWRKSADALFDASADGTDRSAVVGWKLQDLLALQAPSALHPARLEVPSECAFLEAPNLAIASQPLSNSQFLATTVWTGVLKVTVGSVALVSLLLGLLLCHCGRVAARRTCGRDTPSWLVPSAPRDMEIPQAPHKKDKSFWSFCSCQRTLEAVPPPMPRAPGRTYRQLQT